DEDVAVLAILDEHRRRRGVAGDDDSLVNRFEAKAEGIVHFTVVDGKCGDSNVCVSVNMAWHDLVGGSRHYRSAVLSPCRAAGWQCRSPRPAGRVSSWLGCLSGRRSPAATSAP